MLPQHQPEAPAAEPEQQHPQNEESSKPIMSDRSVTQRVAADKEGNMSEGTTKKSTAPGEGDSDKQRSGKKTGNTPPTSDVQYNELLAAIDILETSLRLSEHTQSPELTLIVQIARQNMKKALDAYIHRPKPSSMVALSPEGYPYLELTPDQLRATIRLFRAIESMLASEAKAGAKHDGIEEYKQAMEQYKQAFELHAVNHKEAVASSQAANHTKAQDE